MLSLWLRIITLNQATSSKSPAHSSTGTRSDISILPLFDSVGFHVLFHSPTGVLFTFPSRYCFTIGHLGVFSLTRWSSLIHTGFHVSHATRDKQFPFPFLSKNQQGFWIRSDRFQFLTTGLSPSLVQDSAASFELIFSFFCFPTTPVRKLV